MTSTIIVKAPRCVNSVTLNGNKLIKCEVGVLDGFVTFIGDTHVETPVTKKVRAKTKPWYLEFDKKRLNRARF